MKRSIVVLLHLGYWACYLLLILILLGVYSKSGVNASDQVSRITNAFYSLFLFAFVPSFITFYLFYFILFPKFLQQNKFLLSIIYGLLISVGAAVVGYLLLRYFIESGLLLDMDNGGKNGRTTAMRVIIIMTLVSAISGIMALIIKGFITWFNEIKLKELLKEKNYEMEIALIKSQLDPHLLFNTINNIDALIIKDGVKASNYLNKLSDIMRFMLYETKSDLIPLYKEIEYIEKYIALQKIRTSNANYVHFSFSGDVGSKRIAPMLFIPFIENAFKYTNNKKSENAITIEIIIRAENIQLICENKFDSKLSVHQSDGGLGNELIQKRLNLLYPRNHTLVVQNKDDLYSVNLTITNG